uniref:Uncharacterized protein n=1 Tax=Aegilops tauschii TaxID=37682 RepID=M8BL47_AEGTA
MGGTSVESLTRQRREVTRHPWAVAGSNPSPAALWALDPSSWSTMGSDLIQIGRHGSHRGRWLQFAGLPFHIGPASLTGDPAPPQQGGG